MKKKVLFIALACAIFVSGAVLGAYLENQIEWSDQNLLRITNENQKKEVGSLKSRIGDLERLNFISKTEVRDANQKIGDFIKFMDFISPYSVMLFDLIPDFDRIASDEVLKVIFQKTPTGITTNYKEIIKRSKSDLER